MAERKAKWQNDYIARTYDRINLTVPKGQKEIIQAHAVARGESVNGFIGRAIAEAMQRDNAAPGAVEGAGRAADDPEGTGAGGGFGVSDGSAEENICSRFLSLDNPDFKTAFTDSGQSLEEYITQAICERVERERKPLIPQWIAEQYPGEKWPVLKAVRAIQGNTNAQRRQRASMTPEQRKEWDAEFLREVEEERREGAGQSTPKPSCNLMLD